MCYILEKGCSGNCPHPMHKRFVSGKLWARITYQIEVCEYEGKYIEYDEETCPRKGKLEVKEDFLEMGCLPRACDDCEHLDYDLEMGRKQPFYAGEHGPGFKAASSDNSHVAMIGDDEEEPSTGLENRMQDLGEQDPEEETSSSGNLVMDPNLARMTSQQRQAIYGQRLDAMASRRQQIPIDPDEEEPPGPTMTYDRRNDKKVTKWEAHQEPYFGEVDRLRLHYNSGHVQQAATFTERLVNPGPEFDPYNPGDLRFQYNVNPEFDGQYEHGQGSLAHTEIASSTHSMSHDPEQWTEEQEEFVTKEHKEHNYDYEFDKGQYGTAPRDIEDIYKDYLEESESE